MFTITKVISQFIGEGFIWKKLGIILISISSAVAYFLKVFYDLDVKVSHLETGIEHLTHNNTILRKELHESLDVITKNQEVLMKHQNIVADDNSYWQYLTMRNLFIVLGLGGAALAGFWVWSAFSSNQDLYAALLQQLTAFKEMFVTSTTTLSKVNTDGFERQMTVLEEVLKKLHEINDLLLQQGIEINKLKLSSNLTKNRGFILGNGKDIDGI